MKKPFTEPKVEVVDADKISARWVELRAKAWEPPAGTDPKDVATLRAAEQKRLEARAPDVGAFQLNRTIYLPSNTDRLTVEHEVIHAASTGGYARRLDETAYDRGFANTVDEGWTEMIHRQLPNGGMVGTPADRASSREEAYYHAPDALAAVGHARLGDRRDALLNGCYFGGACAPLDEALDPRARRCSSARRCSTRWG